MLRSVCFPLVRALLLMVLALQIGGCGGDSTVNAPITTRDVGNWRGTASGYINTTQEHPQAQGQSADVSLQVRPDLSFNAAVKITVLEPGSSPSVQSVRDGVLSGSLTSAFAFEGTLTIGESSYPVNGTISRYGAGTSANVPLVLDYTYSDGPTWNVSAILNRAP